MTRLSICRPLFIIVIAGLSLFSQAQPVKVALLESKPYRILTSGKQITVKSNKDIKSVMVWTASGHRIVEQKEVNASSFTFTVNVNEKYFFVMIQYEGQKPFTEKIGIQ
jgi:hypothetical protein